MLRHVIWDFNGTLLNDFDLSLDLVQEERRESGLSPITGEMYRELFCHPISDFYSRMGFRLDGKEYSALSRRFHAAYARRVHGCRLHEGAVEALEWFRSRGVTQSVLSALPHGLLCELADRFSVAGFFESIQGSGDHLAVGKLDYGRTWLFESGRDPASLLLIGDSTHDAEVAQALGVGCVLCCAGFQSRSALEATGYPVIDTLKEISHLVVANPAWSESFRVVSAKE